MHMTWIWMVSIIATLIIADQKKLGVVGYFFLSLITGPIAVLIVLLMSSKNVQSSSHLYETRNNSLEDAKRQLQDLHSSLSIQEEKIKNLEALINKLSGSPTAVSFEKVIKPEIMVEKPLEAVSGEVQVSSISVKKSDMELDFARNWLSKIGIAVLALGIAFLISYSFKYFGPFLKIAFGYIVAGVLFYTGIKLESKDKLMNYGRALMGGAWAIIYFTTYAMYHFEASKIVFNQGVDLILLALVVLGMMAHTLRYKSEEMMAVALFVAYLTSTLGEITSFTIISSLFLAVLVLFLAYKFQWVRILSLGILMTYGIHYIWVEPNIFVSNPMPTLFGLSTLNYHDLMNFIFLTSYCLVFFLGVHLIRSIKDTVLLRTLAVTNFSNIAIYGVLSYPIILKLFYTQRFAIVLAEGLIFLVAALTMKKSKQEKMFVSDMVAAIFAITFSLSLKFFPTTTLLLWLIEIPFLLFIGFNFKEKVFKYFAYALTVLVSLRLLTLTLFGGMPDINFMGMVWTWFGFMCFWASISMAGCFYLTQRFKKETEFDNIDLAFDQVFSFAACFYFCNWIWSRVHQPWIAFSLSMEGWAFLMMGVFLGLRRFRAYAYLALGSSAMIFLCEHIYTSSEFLKWFIVSFNVLSIFGAYHAVKYFKKHKPNEVFLEYEEEISFGMSLLLLIFAIHQYAFVQWISLSLGIASVVLILIGFIGGNKIERMGGMALLALTLGRVVLVDLSGLDILFKIITLIVLGFLFLGVSYIYNRFSIRKS